MENYQEELSEEEIALINRIHNEINDNYLYLVYYLRNYDRKE
jgi:hypothetical protein